MNPHQSRLKGLMRSFELKGGGENHYGTSFLFPFSYFFFALLWNVDGGVSKTVASKLSK
jgi:hypothetical protein